MSPSAKLELGRLLAGGSRLHHTRADQSMDKIGLYRGQALLLMVLSEQDGLPHSEITGKLEISAPAAIKVIKRMEEEHYFQRRRTRRGGRHRGRHGLRQIDARAPDPRLYDASAGAVLVDGYDVRDCPLEELRAHIGVVLQKNTLFSGPIRGNLRWGREDATQAEIEAACRDAQAHEFILSFPQGYDTVLGQGSVNLSGGRKHRPCIAPV